MRSDRNRLKAWLHGLWLAALILAPYKSHADKKLCSSWLNARPPVNTAVQGLAAELLLNLQAYTGGNVRGVELPIAYLLNELQGHDLAAGMEWEHWLALSLRDRRLYTLHQVFLSIPVRGVDDGNYNFTTDTLRIILQSDL